MRATSPTPLNLVSGTGPIGPNSHEDSLMFDLADAIHESLSQIDMSQKAAAACMEIDAGEWSRQSNIRDGSHIHLDKLLKLPPAFWRAFLPKIGAHFGLRVVGDDPVLMGLQKSLHTLADALGALEVRK